MRLIIFDFIQNIFYRFPSLLQYLPTSFYIEENVSCEERFPVDTRCINLYLLQIDLHQVMLQVTCLICI